VDAPYDIVAVSISSRLQYGRANAVIGTEAGAVGGQLSATFGHMFALRKVAALHVVPWVGPSFKNSVCMCVAIIVV
jgi:hypothetical protein